MLCQPAARVTTKRQISATGQRASQKPPATLGSDSGARRLPRRRRQRRPRKARGPRRHSVPLERPWRRRYQVGDDQRWRMRARENGADCRGESCPRCSGRKTRPERTQHQRGGAGRRLGRRRLHLRPGKGRGATLLKVTAIERLDDRSSAYTFSQNRTDTDRSFQFFWPFRLLQDDLCVAGSSGRLARRRRPYGR